MIDLHMHILPGIDDGARDMCESLEMARMSVDSGVTDIVATPHCNVPGEFDNYYGKWYEELFRCTAKVLEEEHIPVRLHRGMEVYVTEETPEHIRRGKVLPINNGRYMLVEFGFHEDPEFVLYMLSKISGMGIRPLIAHAERYIFLHENPWMLEEWKEAGYLIQINRASFQGKFGRVERKMSYDLLEQGYAHVIASDAHRTNRRTPYMDEVYDELCENYPMEYIDRLFMENPRKILENVKIL